MKFESIMIDEKTRLDAYICDKNDWFTRKAILVFPGGGYAFLADDREGEPIAQAFIPYGFNAFVLHYTVDCKHPYPHQLIQASKAMKHIRDHAEEYGIDPKEVYVAGFSAGGHLCGTLALQWNKQEIYDAIPMPYGYNKPKGILLIYPLVSTNPKFSLQGIFMNLFCTATPTKEQLDSVSLEQLVTADAVPAYIVHGAADDVVSVEHSLMLATAYSKAKVPFELHIYPKCKHGFALGNEITCQSEDDKLGEHAGRWVEQAVRWIKSLDKGITKIC